MDNGEVTGADTIDPAQVHASLVKNTIHTRKQDLTLVDRHELEDFIETGDAASLSGAAGIFFLSGGLWTVVGVIIQNGWPGLTASTVFCLMSILIGGICLIYAARDRRRNQRGLRRLAARHKTD